MRFDDILQQYGGDPASLLKFDVDGPELPPYATLTAARLSGDVDLAALGGVYEWQDRPLLFLVDGTLLDGNLQRLSRIRRLVAMRGDAPYLAVVTSGSMMIYQVGLEGDAAQARVSIGNPYVIVGKKKKQHLTDLQHPWWRIRSEALLDDVRIHDLRHTFASGGLQIGEGLSMIGKLLGHT